MDIGQWIFITPRIFQLFGKLISMLFKHVHFKYCLCFLFVFYNLPFLNVLYMYYRRCSSIPVLLFGRLLCFFRHSLSAAGSPALLNSDHHSSHSNNHNGHNHLMSVRQHGMIYLPLPTLHFVIVLVQLSLRIVLVIRYLV